MMIAFLFLGLALAFALNGGDASAAPIDDTPPTDGTDGDDQIDGSANGDLLNGHDGNDTILGGAGDDIILFGRSLGAAVAAWLAARQRPRAVILESAFTSAASLGAEHYPWLPVDLLLRHRYDTLARVSEIRAPLLVVHSRDDEIVPFHHGRALFDAAAEPKRLLEIRGGHNDGFLASGAIYRDALAAFLAAAGDARKRSTDPIPGRP